VRRGGLCGRADLKKGFLNLRAQAFRFKDAGAQVGRDAELRGGRAGVELGFFFLGKPDGDAGSLSLLGGGDGDSIRNNAFFLTAISYTANVSAAGTRRCERSACS
jgi:hypothetical protein